MDYVVKIDDNAIVYDTDDTIGTLTGSLLDGQLFQGTDTIKVRSNEFNTPQTVPEPATHGVIALLLSTYLVATSRRRR